MHSSYVIFDYFWADILCIVRSAEDAQELTTKAGKQIVKRELLVYDDSGAEIKLTLWDNTVR